MEKTVKILHIYPDLLNLYGDKGNIAALTHRLSWRGIKSEVIAYCGGELDLSDIDIVFLGGGSDRDEKIVCSALQQHRDALSQYVENGGVMLAVCGGFPMLGNFYYLGDEKIEGLSVLDMYATPEKDRIIGDVVISSTLTNSMLVGFENRSVRVISDKYSSLGDAIAGNSESVVYKNLIATFMHGPLLPKNPELCDYILSKALKNHDGLTKLDDTEENNAKNAITARFIK